MRLRRVDILGQVTKLLVGVSIMPHSLRVVGRPSIDSCKVLKLTHVMCIPFRNVPVHIGAMGYGDTVKVLAAAGGAGLAIFVKAARLLASALQPGAGETSTPLPSQFPSFAQAAS